MYIITFPGYVSTIRVTSGCSHLRTAAADRCALHVYDCQV